MKKLDNKTIAIIQARMGSSRFPGKMVAKLGSYAVIEWVLWRVKRAKMLGKVVLATSDLPQDDVLVKIADQYDVSTYRGSETDVLKRFVNAASEYEAETIIRVCADNPFIDPNEIDRLVKFFVSKNCNYAFNHQSRLNSKYADGFGAEIFSFKVLNKINKLAQDPRHREHITLYLWEADHPFIMMPVPAPKYLSYPHLCFDIDLPEDKDKMDLIVNNGATIESSAEQIINIYFST